MDTNLANWIAGGLAGISVDAALYPLDAIKTRLQAKSTNIKTPTSIYAGISATMLGSFPSGAAFFGSYELSKSLFAERFGDSISLPIVHIASASMAEVVACSIRVPFEVVKQQLQVGMHQSVMEGVSKIYKQHRLAGFFVGYISTVAREIPFDAIQFTLWEHFKIMSIQGDANKVVHPLTSAACGCVAGGIAAAITTPLDVAKTRLMTQQHKGEYEGLVDCLVKIYKFEGPQKLFLGVVPRTVWIGFGGFVFFGAFESFKYLLRRER